MKPTLTLKIALLVILGLCVTTRAADDKPIINFAGKDIAGNDVKIPSDRPSVVAFVRPDQDQSKEALKQIHAAVSDPKSAQVIVILSGPTAAESAKAIYPALTNGWPVVTDEDFADSGKMGVHVWPTTLVIKSDGTQIAHLAGLSGALTVELNAYLDFAAGKLDDAGLQKRLTGRDVITDSPAQIAARYLQMAQRSLEQGQPEEARTELAEGLKNAPQDPQLLITMARVCVMLNQPKNAVDILDKLAAGSVPTWQTSLIRGRALIALEKWPDAKAILPEAQNLNPDPAEAHYLLGLCYQHDQDFPHAAEQFKLAFEKSSSGQKAAILPPAK